MGNGETVKTPDAVLRNIPVGESSQKLMDQKGYRQQEAISKLIFALPDALRRGLEGGRIHGEKLVLRFAHPGHEHEFRNRKAEIMQGMREIYRAEGLRGMIVFRDVVTESEFRPPPAPKQEVKQEYTEPAKGEFSNVLPPGEMRDMFERIRAKIKENQEKER